MRMKKLLAACLCTGFLFTLSGCTSLGSILEQYGIGETAPVPEEDTSESTRVYMDELAGQIQDFSGDRLTLLAEGTLYTFDVSQASLECQNGIISGDEVSIIYEGQLNGTDTSQVKALKVVDEINKKNQLEDRTAYGRVLSLTPNTITIRSKSGKTATYPITGTEQYYQNGIKPRDWVYLHFKGKFPSSSEEDPQILDAGHLKVTSISNIDPIRIPNPTPTPLPEEETEESEQEKEFQAVIQDISLEGLTVLPQGGEEELTIGLTSIPVYLKGGAAPGSHVTVVYTGEFDGRTLSEITVLAVTGEDPAKENDRHISFTVSGTIVGSTANTTTIQTADGALVTCTTQGAENSSTGGMLVGSSIQVTFNPSRSGNSNIYTSLKIEDA